MMVDFLHLAAFYFENLSSEGGLKGENNIDLSGYRQSGRACEDEETEDP